VAIDGSKFKAVNNRNRNFTSNKIKQRIKQIDDSIKRFLFEITSADRQETAASKGKAVRLKGKITKLKKEVAYLNEMGRTTQALPDKQVSLTDPDSRAMANMAEQAQEVLDAESLSVVADRGYYNGAEIRACDKLGITTYVPKTKTSGNQAKGLYGKQDFIYRAEDDEYECPAGERLIYRFTGDDKGIALLGLLFEPAEGPQ
jgi:hypothetical protein